MRVPSSTPARSGGLNGTEATQPWQAGAISQLFYDSVATAKRFQREDCIIVTTAVTGFSTIVVQTPDGSREGDTTMKYTINGLKRPANRRSFIKKGLAAGTVTLAAGTLANSSPAKDEDKGGLDKGDAAILRFLAAAEIIETDLWIQYNELGGVQDSEVPGITGGSAAYIAALQVLDGDMPQYIHDNTEDEMTHHQFINAYLASKGATPVNLDQFRTLPSSKATGARQIGRLTNLMQLTVDTSWWTRYRSRANNPDLDPTFVFPQAIPSLHVGQHPAIPRSDADLTPHNHIQAIANTAGFHFAFIEQGGTSLYP